jgi:hypothetical protein
MTPLKLLAAFTATAAVSTAAYVGVVKPLLSSPPAPVAQSQAVSQNTDSPPGKDDAAEARVICVGGDNVVRAPAADGTCAEGERTIEIDPGDATDCDDCDPWGGGESSQGAKDQISRLTARLNRLERSPLLTVVSSRGEPIFEVKPDGAYLYAASQGTLKPLAVIRASDSGGYFVGRSATESLQSIIGVTEDFGGVKVYDRYGASRISLGTKGGFASLSFPKSGGVAAGIGESMARSGTLIVGDINGKMKTSFTVTKSDGFVAVQGRSGHTVVGLYPKASGGGMLEIGTAEGDPKVKMGNNYEKYGIVVTGPRGLPLVMGSGLPASYFLGCAGGPVCSLGDD